MSEEENNPSSTVIASTQDPAYAKRLETLEAQGWKQRLDVQALIAGIYADSTLDTRSISVAESGAILRT